MAEDSNTATDERKSGILTKSDRIWLNLSAHTAEVDSKYDQKRRCKQGVARAMEDIAGLVETDFSEVSNLDDLVELFGDIHRDSHLSIEECATSLIALAYIITNQDINYPEIIEKLVVHPRESDDKPSSDDRPKAGGYPLNEDVSDLLAFRYALSEGIKRGKRKLGESYPSPVLIDTNTTLFKPPTRGEIDPDNNGGFDYDDVRDAYAHHLDATKPPGFTETSQGSFGRKEGIEYVNTIIKLNVGSAITARRSLSDKPVKSGVLISSQEVITEDDLPVSPELADTRDELLEIASEMMVSRTEFYKALFTAYFSEDDTSKSKEEKVAHLKDQIKSESVLYD